jgi:hypothetical protein
LAARFFIIVLMAMTFFSCEKSTFQEAKDYFPVSDKAEAIYEIQETRYAINEEQVSRKYYLRERYSEKFETGASFTVKMERFLKNKPSDNWRLDSIWTLRKLGSEYVLNANNEEKVLIIQPLSEKSLWNINTYNTQKEKKIRAINFAESLISLNPEWLDLAKVTVSSDSSLLEKNLELRYYKDKVGLVYKVQKNVVYCQDTPDCIGKKQISYGLEISQKRLNALP